MTTQAEINFAPVAKVDLFKDRPEVLVICEHGSNRVPAGMGNLGLSQDALQSHIAWDPGAGAVAHKLAKALSACCITGNVSRLVYDCNRPPDAPSAMPEKSELYEIPGNENLSAEAKQLRIDGVYLPFCKVIADHTARFDQCLKLLVTIHSFTPTYNGQSRNVELGVLHGKDPEFAHEMMRSLPAAFPYLVELNAPYSAADGVAHSLDIHGSDFGLPNVMIEVRNDLIATPADQARCASALASWIKTSAQAKGIFS